MLQEVKNSSLSMFLQSETCPRRNHQTYMAAFISRHKWELLDEVKILPSLRQQISTDVVKILDQTAL